MPSGDAYGWIGAAGGTWDVAANWQDLTTGADPALTIPGSADAAAIAGLAGGAFLLIEGDGAASSLALSGASAFAGTIAVGVVNLSQISSGNTVIPAALELTAGATLAAGSFSFAGGQGRVFVDGSAALLQLGGVLAGAGDDAITVANGGSLRAGSLVLLPFDLLDVADARSSIEIGAGGSAVAGAITVDPAATLSGSGTISGSVIDFGTIVSEGLVASGALAGNGTILVPTGGSFTDPANAGGRLGFLVGAGGTLALGDSVAAGVSISLAGSDDLLAFGLPANGNVSAPSGLAMAGTIIGLTFGDVILGDLASAPASLSYSQAGVLTLSGAAGQALGTLALAGGYAAQNFVLTELPGSGAFQINLAETGRFAISQGTTGTDAFVWTGPVGGAWGDAANWHDLSATSSVAPGARDDVAIAGLTGGEFLEIGGAGQALSLALTGAVALAGTLSAPLVNLAQSGTGAAVPGVLEVAAGATLDAANFAFTGSEGSLFADGSGALIAVSIMLSGGGDDQITAANGGTISLGGLTLEAFDQVAVDTRSAILVGTGLVGTGLAAPGVIKVSAGATLSGSGTLDSPLVDAGVVFSDGLAALAAVSGSGSVTVAPGGSFTALAPVGGNLQFLVGQGGTIAFGTTVGAAVGITLTGSSDVLSFGQPAGAGTIAGLAEGDVILIDLASAPAKAVYSASAGVLSLLGSSGTALATLALAGSLAGADFVLTALPGAGEVQVNLAEAGSFALSAGSGSHDTFLWTGLTGGNWGDGRNWHDLTAAGTIAPGAGDAVAISGLAGGPYLVICGNGDAASLALTGATAFSGTVTTAVVNLSQLTNGATLIDAALELTAGATLSAGRFAFAGGNGAISVEGTGAALRIGQTLTGAGDDALTVAQGGTMRAGAVVLQAFDQLAVADTASSIEIGTGGAAVAGAIVVDPRATLSGSGSLLGSVVDDGLIGASALLASGTLSGSGTIAVAAGGSFTDLAATTGSLTLRIGAGGTLDLGTTIGAGTAISLTGTAGVLEFGVLPYATRSAPASLAMAGTISGFTTGDLLLAALAAAPAQVAYSSGLLTLRDSAGHPLGTIALAGSYANADFLLAALPIAGQFEVEIVPCFAAGTEIATASGARPVETLRIGETVRTASGRLTAVQWIGHRHVACKNHPAPDAVCPVRIVADAFGPGLPRRELFLSPDHAVYAGGALIPVRHLRNGASVAQRKVTAIDYYHVALDRHDLLLAEGLAAESYLETGNLAQFGNAETYPAHLPATPAMPLCVSGPVLEALRRDLQARLPALGFMPLGDADLALHWGEKRLWSTGRTPGLLRTLLPPGCTRPRLVNDPGCADGRSLGAQVASVSLDGRLLKLDGRAFGPGFYPVERKWRWTDGDAMLLLPGGRLLEIIVSATASGWVERKAFFTSVKTPAPLSPAPPHHIPRYPPSRRFPANSPE